MFEPIVNWAGGGLGSLGVFPSALSPGGLAALCGPDGFRGVAEYGLLAGLLIGGASGSLVHCAPMCGPFVLGQVADRMARIPAARLCEARRIGSGALPFYHAGRLTTYAVLGAAAGLAGRALTRLAWLDHLAGALLLLAALLFAAHALRRLLPAGRAGAAGRGESAGGWTRLLARLGAGIGQERPLAGLLTGLVLGLLPCGFLYAALTVAAASLSPLQGALAMAAFGLGTVPVLVATGIAGQAGGRAWAGALAWLGPAVLLLNAGLLATLGLARFGA